MIFVAELDVYLRSFYYWINFDLYAQDFDLPEELKTWKQFLDGDQNLFKTIEVSAEKFGFIHEFGRAKGMCGEKEMQTKRMNFYLPFDGLRIYPRLLYSDGYLPKPSDFELHKYYFTYYPKLLMPFFKRLEDNSWKITLQHYWTSGTHRHIEETKEHRIAYNVSVPVNLHTIIEEELHSLSEEVHGTTKAVDVLKSITSKDPNLGKEIELNLNHILSAEEKRFRDFGDLIQKEEAPEIRKLERFCNLFEEALIRGQKL